MGFSIPVSKGEKVSDGSDRKYDPLEAGKYVVSVFDAKLGKYTKPGGNKDRPNYNIQYRIADGQTGANRRIFSQIGLFATWGATSKNPNGSDNFAFFKTIAALTGRSEKDIRAEYNAVTEEGGEYEIPSPSELKGRKAVLTLKIVPDTYAFDTAQAKENEEAKAEKREPETLDQEDFKRNEIAGWAIYDGSLPAAGGSQTDAPKIEAVTL